MRSTRDLLRRRLHLVRKRGQLLAHIQNTRAQYNLATFARRLAYPANREGVTDRFSDPSVRKSIEVDVALVDTYDGLITDLELTIVREATFVIIFDKAGDVKYRGAGTLSRFFGIVI